MLFKYAGHFSPLTTILPVQLTSFSNHRLKIIGFLGLVAPLLLAGCSDNATLLRPTLAAETTKPLSVDAEYRLGSGDRLRILVFGEEDLSGEFTIDDRGSVDLPLIAEVRAAGASIRQLEERVVAGLQKGYLLDPRVSIDVLNYRPFFIQGEVKEAGEYPFKSGLSAIDAVAIAGGYSFRANKKRIHIRHAGDAEERAYDLTKQRILVRPGDNIRIPERFF